jgi:Hypoxia induced protein conserved region
MVEGFLAKTWRRMREEPLVPLGMGLTVAAFVGASRAMRKGDHARVNVMFRRRIYAQAFTLVMIVAGSYYMADEKAKRKKMEDLERQERAAVRKEQWLGELDQRDEDDRIARETVQKLMQRRKEREATETSKKKASMEPLPAAGDTPESSTKSEDERRAGMLGKAKNILGYNKPKD